MGLFARSGGLVSSFLFIAATIRAADRPAPVSMTELLPATEVGSALIRNTAELQRKGDELIDGVGVPMRFRFSTLAPLVVGWMGVRQESFDRQAPVGLVLTSRANPRNFEGIVTLVPYTTREAITNDVKLTVAPREIGRVQLAEEAWKFWKLGAVDDRNLYLSVGNDEEVSRAALESMLGDARLSSELSPAARERVNRSDLLVHWGVAEHRRLDRENLTFNWRLDEKALDGDERPIAEALVSACDQLQHYLMTVTLEDGVALHQRLVFHGESDQPAGRLLGDLRGIAESGHLDARQPTLTGLPVDQVLAAGSVRTTGVRQQLLLRTIARLLSAEAGSWLNGSPWSWNGGQISDVRQVVVLGALAEVLPLAQEMRFAIYPNPDGTFGVVLILDAEEPQRLVETIRELSDFVRAGSGGDGVPEEAKSVATEAEIRKLIRQLAADDYAVRSRATTRLLLLGAEARALLKAAAEADDPEVATRARRLLAKSDLSHEGREERLLRDNPLAALHPQLTYEIGGERIGDISVDVIYLELKQQERSFEPQLRGMLGSDWNRVRMVQMPRAVIVGLGGVGGRLVDAIENVEHGRAGLAYDAGLVRLPDDPQRLIELHVPLSRFVPEASYRTWTGGEPRDASPSRALTACGLSASQEELWFDVHFPLEEVRGLVVKRGWSW
ncbi:MAG: hypothetical protein KDA75_12050 [Planctomycetaceae bacterium]|nr:hypothetical protein [Planctomycetaceae bacterium]